MAVRAIATATATATKGRDRAGEPTYIRWLGHDAHRSTATTLAVILWFAVAVAVTATVAIGVGGSARRGIQSHARHPTDGCCTCITSGETSRR
jgi:hypothetical protein